MMATQLQIVNPFRKMKQIAILRKPFIGYHRNLARWQGKFLFPVKDMIFKLDERDAVRPKPYNGMNIKPVVIFFYLEVNFAVAKYIALLAFGLLQFKAFFNQLIVVLVK